MQRLREAALPRGCAQRLVPRHGVVGAVCRICVSLWVASSAGKLRLTRAVRFVLAQVWWWVGRSRGRGASSA